MFGTPPQGRADYAFIQHVFASMEYTKRAYRNMITQTNELVKSLILFGVAT